MDHVARLAQGQHIYVAPSLHYIPLAYMPLFATVSSFLARAFGPALWEPRLVAFSASLVLAALMAVVAFAETRRATLAVAAPGIFFMAFSFTGACYDIARPDSLMLALAFGGLVVLRFTRGVPGALVAALLLTLGFFTKQHAVLFGLAGMAYLLFHDRRRFLPFALALLVGCAGGYGLLTAWLGDWFRVYTWSIPRGWSQLSPVRIEHYLGQNLFGVMGALSVTTLLSFGLAERATEKSSVLWYWVWLAAIGTGLMATLDPYAYHHLFMPSLVGLCFVGPVALDRVGRQAEAGSGGARGLGTAAIYAVAAAQFMPLLYPAHSLRPHVRGPEAHDALVQKLRDIPGDVLMPYHGWYDHESGREGSLQIIALDDIERSRGNAIFRQDPKAIERLFEPLRSGANRPTIVTDVYLDAMGGQWRSLVPHYRLADSLGWMTESLRPVGGNKFAPTYVYVPVEPEPAAAAAPAPASALRP